MERAGGGQGNGVAGSRGAVRHSDDELADALQAEVDRATAAIPIVAGPSAARGAGSARNDDVTPEDAAKEGAGQDDVGGLSDEQVTAIIDADLRIHDTTAAIRLLQTVLDARATAAVPVMPAPVEEDESDDEGHDDGGWAGPPTQLISFDDLPVPRRDHGPQPTYSAWVGAAAARPEPAPAPQSVAAPQRAAEPPVAPPKFPTLATEVPLQEPGHPDAGAPAADTAADTAQPARVEPLGLVPEKYAPRDSQPVPVLSDALPVAVAAAIDAGATSAPTAAHDGGPVAAPSGDIVAGPAPHTDTPHTDAPHTDLGPRTRAAVGSPRTAPPAVLSAAALTNATPTNATPTNPAPFIPEATDLGPTPLDQRAGRASRMFWLWFAGTSSLISVGVGATLFLLGLSLRQLLVATLVGVGLSFLPLGLGTLAGKWSGQPTMVVSRATFGLLGNALPTALALVTKLFWGALLLWLAGSAAGSLAVSEGWTPSAAVPTGFALVVTIAAAGVVAYFGYGLVARVQLVLTIASALLIATMIAATWRHVDLSRALAVPDAFWTHVVTGAVLVFSYVGLAWAMSSAEVARYQRRRSSGAAGMLWATFGAGVPPFVLVSYGGLLAASDPRRAAELAHDPVAGFVALGLPAWYPVPLLLAVGLSLISALVLTIYSGGFTLDALGVRLGRRWSTVIVGAAIAVAGVVLALTVRDLDVVVRGLPTALSVPVAAWAGLFAGEMMLRTRRFHHSSLLKRGGVYPDWRWTNVAMLVVASVVGLGFVASPLPWLAWEGYLFRLLGAAPGIGATNIGVVIALGLGLITPLVSGVREVRRQERASA